MASDSALRCHEEISKRERTSPPHNAITLATAARSKTRLSKARLFRRSEAGREFIAAGFITASRHALSFCAESSRWIECRWQCAAVTRNAALRSSDPQPRSRAGSSAKATPPMSAIGAMAACSSDSTRVCQSRRSSGSSRSPGPFSAEMRLAEFGVAGDASLAKR
jgi:hypothetical protein